jgi:glycosyltransferase involved in cell wall biosynthesis
VGYAGALTRDKGIDQLIRAFARLQHRSQLRLVIAGGGTDRRSFDRLASARSLSNVIFLGAVDYESMPGFMASLDLYVVPSLTETLPTTMLEALGTGTPVMATGVGGTADFLQSQFGILLRDARAETIAEAIDEWRDRREELRQMGNAGQRRVLAEHSWDKTGLLTEEVYLQCLREHRA